MSYQLHNTLHGLGGWVGGGGWIVLLAVAILGFVLAFLLTKER